MFKFLTIVTLMTVLGCNNPSENVETPNGETATNIFIKLDRVAASPTRDINVTVKVTPSLAITSNFKLDLNSFTLTAEYGNLKNMTLNSAKNQFEAVLTPPDKYSTTYWETVPNTAPPTFINVPNDGSVFEDTWSGRILIKANYKDTANSLDLKSEKEALIISTIHPSLGQPESVSGLVNTPGVEDSPQVSPDGQYLIVGTYSPVDLAYCQISGGNFYDSPACNKNTYDFTGVKRPSPFGEDRLIDNNTIIHTVSNINYDYLCERNPNFDPNQVASVTNKQFLDTDIDGNAPCFPISSPPVSSYGFKRQVDGSYGEPFVIGIDIGGYSWSATYGFTFDLTSPTPQVFYSFNQPEVDTEANNIYYSPINLGTRNVFAEYIAGVPSIDLSTIKVPINTADVCGKAKCEYGNPHITANRLWFDNERDTYNLFYLDVSRDSNGVITGYSSAKEVILNKNIDEGESMPYMDGQDLYYMCDTKICRSTLTVGLDPSFKSSWNPEEILMDGATDLSYTLNGGRSGRITAVSEPSIARIKAADGTVEKWLYHGYIMQIHYDPNQPLEFGGDWAVGRVRLY